MNKDQLTSYIIKNIPFSATNSQRQAAETFAEFLLDSRSSNLFLLKGYAGTGKTTTINACVSTIERLGIKAVLIASTGRAAKTLKSITEHSTSTIHKLIYRIDEVDSEMTRFALSRNKDTNTLFIVDEASMISGDRDFSEFGSGNLLEDLMCFVYSNENCKLMIVGDTAQLPPVGSDLSNALEKDKLSLEYGMNVFEVTLTDVVRQQKKSGILHNATLLRNLIDEYSSPSNNEEIPVELELKNFSDIIALDGSELIDNIDDSYRKYGIENCLAVCLSNKTALRYNIGIRQRVLDYEEPLVKGERLIVCKNNYFYTDKVKKNNFIANGNIIEVQRIRKRQNMYELEYSDVEIFMPDSEDEKKVKLLISSLFDEKPQLSYDDRKKLFNIISQDYPHLINNKKALWRKIKQNEYWNALEVKYGYAVTAHKSQGGQWQCVFIDMGALSYFPLNRAMVRWLYTAITRSTEKVYLVNCPNRIIK